MQISTNQSINDAIAKAGGQKQLAIDLGVTQQFISASVQKGFLPPERAMQVEQMYGIPRKKMVNPKLAKLLGDAV